MAHIYPYMSYKIPPKSHVSINLPWIPFIHQFMMKPYELIFPDNYRAIKPYNSHWIHDLSHNYRYLPFRSLKIFFQHHMAPSLPRCFQPCFHQHGLHDRVAAHARRQGHTEPPRRCARRRVRDGGSGDPGRPVPVFFLGGKMAAVMAGTWMKRLENWVKKWMKTSHIRIHGAAVYISIWYHGFHQYTHFKLAFFYQHHRSVMGMDEIDGNMDENMWMINLMNNKTCSKNLSSWNHPKCRASLSLMDHQR